MLPLRVALLWHNHQPLYRIDDEFVLPWVRLHALKDYADLLKLHLEFPALRLSYNIVPSLLMQLRDYAKGVEDRPLALSRIPATDLLEDQKREILHTFFRCQLQTMVLPYPRYRELYESSRDAEHALEQWSAQEWRDLQLWYILCWIGPVSREMPAFRRLFDKGRDFSEEDKAALLVQHTLLLESVVPLHREIHRSGLAELSMTPLYHPILPLLIDTDSAKEALPEIELPTKRYRQKHDAEWHVHRGRQIFEEECNTSPRGMWCSEGSISDESLDILCDAGFLWTATDEQVLRETKASAYQELDQYFVHWYARERRQRIALFFRDHQLSDAIGFVYQSWNADDAARDFVNRLKAIRSRLVHERGEDSLKEAVVPVILDGENCWEYYPDNGVHFLRALYKALESDEELRSCTFSEVTQSEMVGADALHHHMHPRSLDHIRAGSWIHANFRIWIGHPEKNAAWDALHAARLLVDTHRVTNKQWRDAMEHIYVAEGSDWFWWFGDDHQSETRGVFDEVFRYHLRRVYEIYRMELPAVLLKPIMTATSQTIPTYSTMHAVSTFESRT